MAKVSPIFKNGSKSDLNNYRPISVIPTVAKIFEKIIYDQLYQYLNENGLLNSGQSGFRSLHSTLTALLETSDNWCVNIDRGLLNGQWKKTYPDLAFTLFWIHSHSKISTLGSADSKSCGLACRIHRIRVD